MPSSRDQLGDLLIVKVEVLRLGSVGRPTAAPTGAGERAAEEAVGGLDAQQRHAQGGQRKKVVTPGAKAVAHLQKAFEVSRHLACAVLSVDRTMVRCTSRRRDDPKARDLIRELASQCRRFGYRRLQWLLCGEGWSMNPKKFRHLYREERLQVRRRGDRKRAPGTGAPMTIPQGPNQRRSLDFVSDAYAGLRYVPARADRGDGRVTAGEGDRSVVLAAKSQPRSLVRCRSVLPSRRTTLDSGGWAAAVKTGASSAARRAWS